LKEERRIVFATQHGGGSDEKKCLFATWTGLNKNKRDLIWL